MLSERQEFLINYVPILLVALFMILLPISPVGDIYYFARASRVLLNGGLIYRDVEFTYPPIYAYLNAFAILILGDNMYAWKIVPVIFQVAATVLIWKFTRDRSALYLSLLSPLPLFAVAYWGSFDVVSGFFAVLSAILLLRNRNLSSAFALALGINIKYFPVVLLVPLLLYLKRDRLKYLTTVVATSLVINLPFMLLTWKEWLQQILLYHLNRESGGASIYNLITWRLWGGPSQLGLLLPFSLIILTIFAYKQREKLVLNASVFLLATVLFNKVVLFYAQWFVPFIILSYVLLRRDKVVLLSLLVCQSFLLFSGFTYGLYVQQISEGPILALGWIYFISTLILFIRLILLSRNHSLTESP